MNDRVIGHYRILEKIGAGAMGEVFRARDERLGRDVALKVIHAGSSGNPDHVRRFEVEARSAAALNHPNIVAIYDVGFDAGSPYIVCELLEGQTLRQRLFEGPLPVRLTVDYALQIIQGLIAAHERRIVHHDLKPENLFTVTRDGRVKILDFGVAKASVRWRRRPHRRRSHHHYQGRRGHRHGRLHVAGTIARQIGRPSQRHLQHRRNSL